MIDEKTIDFHYGKGEEFYENKLIEIGFENGVMLDVGCNAGYWGFHAVKLNKKVHGIDSSAEFIKYANMKKKELKQSRRKRLVFKCTKTDTLPFKDEHFDYIFCRATINFVHWKETLKEMHRVLKPGGLIYLSDVEDVGKGKLKNSDRLIKRAITEDQIRSFLFDEFHDLDVISVSNEDDWTWYKIDGKIIKGNAWKKIVNKVGYRFFFSMMIQKDSN